MPDPRAILLAAALAAGTYGVNKTVHAVHNHVIMPIAHAVAHPFKAAKAVAKHQVKK